MGIICPLFRRGCHQKSPSRGYILTNPCWNEFSLGQACPSTNGIFYSTPRGGPFGHIPYAVGDIALPYPPPPLSLDCSCIYTADRIQVALVLPFCEVVMIKYLETSRASRAPAARAFFFALTEVSLYARYLSQWRSAYISTYCVEFDLGRNFLFT